MKKRYTLVALLLPLALSGVSGLGSVSANEQTTVASPSNKEEFKTRLVITEDSKEVYNDNFSSRDVENAGDSYVIDLDKLKKISVDRFYTYENSVIEADGKSIVLEDNKLKISKNTKQITIKLAKRKELWHKVSVTYPSEVTKDKKETDIKSYSSFADFRRENQDFFQEKNNSVGNYTFSHYEVENEDINTYNGIITSDLNVKAIYKTKIVFKNYNNSLETYHIDTGEKINVNLARYQRADYDIVSFDIVNNRSGKVVKNISREELENMLVEESITIIPKYEPKKSKVMVRQDNYNKRFGKVDASLENYDVEWEATKPISGLLDELKKKIKPNDGYELQFRINRKQVDPNSFIKEETLLEIYFKKKEGSWVNVKFTGEGIDKFLSDGQEVLAGSRIDSINLPTSQGSNKEFVGWTANIDYKYQIGNKTIVKKKDSIIKTVDLPHVVTSKNQNLIFTAKYLENYKITISSVGPGTAILTNSDNSFSVKEGTLVKNNIDHRKLLTLANVYFRFSHLTTDHAVMIKDDKGVSKLVNAGEKIELQDFYNIVGHRDLNITAHFTFSDGVTMLDNYLIKNDILLLEQERNYNSTLEDALGPLNYLR